MQLLTSNNLMSHEPSTYVCGHNYQADMVKPVAIHQRHVYISTYVALYWIDNLMDRGLRCQTTFISVKVLDTF